MCLYFFYFGGRVINYVKHVVWLIMGKDVMLFVKMCCIYISCDVTHWFRVIQGLV